MSLPPEHRGTQVIVEGTEPIKADIFFVHGLQGHPTKSWSMEAPHRRRGSLLSAISRFRSPATARATGEPSSSVDMIFWPRDCLPLDIANVRILTYGYDSNVVRTFAPANTNNIFQHARDMLEDIQRHRLAAPNRPAIFVCHSLGGIITKEALRVSRGATFQPHLLSLYPSTHGIIFFGTPHRGTSMATWAILASNLARLALQAPNPTNLRALEVDSAALQIVADEFSTMIRNDVKVHSFYEGRGMSGLYGLHGKIVDDFSSIIGDAAEGKEAIDANHQDMCKFCSRNDNGYLKVFGVIRRWVNEAFAQNSLRGEEDNLSLDHFPPAVSQKIKRDAQLNLLTYRRDQDTTIFQLPYFSASILSTSLAFTLPTNINLGNSGFELAEVLQLLPDQANATHMDLQDVHLNAVIYDENFYYCKISLEGLLRLACTHFSMIREDADALIVRTKIGTFIFRRIELGLVVRFNGRERSSSMLAPEGQDFSMVKNCAQGLFRLRKDSNLEPGEDYSHLPLSWERITFHKALLAYDSDHPHCLRFMTTQDLDEFRFQKSFADVVLESLNTIVQEQRQAFKALMDGLELMRLFSTKVVNEPSQMALAAAVFQIVIMRTYHPSTTSPNDDHAQKILWLEKAENLHNLLLGEYRLGRSPSAVYQKLREVADQDVKLAATQGCFATLIKANTGIILSFAVEAPLLWLEMLTMSDVDILIG